MNMQGIVRNIKFQIENDITVKIWKPENVELLEFKENCDFVIKYLIDEGFLKSKRCRVKIMKKS